MRISDWSSDVCSSDLGRQGQLHAPARGPRPRPCRVVRAQPGGTRALRGDPARRPGVAHDGLPGAADRKRVVEGKRVSVRVDLAGSRIIKTINQQITPYTPNNYCNTTISTQQVN